MIKRYLERIPGAAAVMRMKAANRGQQLPTPAAFPQLTAEEQRELREGAWRAAKRHMKDVKIEQK